LEYGPRWMGWVSLPSDNSMQHHLTNMSDFYG
jgi:hypothetical protein